MDYTQASNKLTGRNYTSRKIGNHTYLKRRHIPGANDSAFAVRLHNTDVLTFYPDGRIKLENGGYPTCTTHDRMNTYLPKGYVVSGEPLETQRSGSGMSVLRRWHYDADTYVLDGEVTIDNSAMILADGTLDGGDVAAYRERRREERNAAMRPRRRAQYWTRKAREHAPYRGTVASIMEEENVSVRVAKMACYGIERFFLDSNASVLDTSHGYQLLEIALNAWERVRALKMACTTTNAVYVNQVPPNISTVAEGLDWMFNTTDYLGTVGQQA